MSRTILLLLVIALGLRLIAAEGPAAAHDPASQSYSGNRGNRISRLPWRAGSTVRLAQGWRSDLSPSEPGGTHGGQYAVDWGTTSNSSYDVYTASEGNATCEEDDGGWGNRVDLVRVDGKTERYAHLIDCPFPEGTIEHFEQGQYLERSFNSGIPTRPIHLHYELLNGTNDNQRCQSQFCDLYNNTYHYRPYFSPSDPGYHHNHAFTADNAGPGVGNGINPLGAGAMWNEYTQYGHFFCPPGHAWGCLGSSASFYGDLVKATEVTLRGEDGWHQDFNGGSLGWTGIDWPSEENCGVAYWMPSNVWSKWMLNINLLGHPRSPIHEIPTQIPYFPTGPGWYQFFANGYIYHPDDFNGANPTVHVLPSLCM